MYVHTHTHKHKHRPPTGDWMGQDEEEEGLALNLRSGMSSFKI